MQEMTYDSWRRRGSSVVFDKEILGALITEGCLVSLREALSWMNSWPASPPIDSNTVLVGGLETCLELLEPKDGESFLQQRIKPFIQEFQHRWDSLGLVFGFGCSEKCFIEDSYENVLFSIPGNKEIQLSSRMWGVSAPRDLCALYVKDSKKIGRIKGGYHVKRLS
jgi:hypothetical protein